MAEAAPASPPLASRARSTSSYVPGLDGYRALAALMVLVFHVAERTDLTVDDQPFVYAIRPLGALGVSIFFVLSGFLLFRPFVAAHLADDPPPRIGRYLLRRVLRVFPAYWLALVATVYVFGSPERTFPSLGDFVSIVTLQHGYDARTALSGVPVAWTLTVEVTFYAFLPFFALLPPLLAGRRPTPRERFHMQLISIALIFALAAIIRFMLIDSGARLVSTFPSMMDWFAVGMLLATLRAWFDRGHDKPAVVRLLLRRPEYALVGAAVAFAGVVALRLDGGFVRLGLGDHMGRNALFAAIGLCLVGPVALGADGRRPLLRALEHPIVRWFGLISYGVYLWHSLVLFELRPELIEHFGMGTGFWPALVSTLVGTAAIAAVSWYLFENPIITYGRALQGRGRKATPARPAGAQ